MKIDVFTAEEISQRLGITQDEFKTAKKNLKFVHASKNSKGAFLYPETVVAQIAEYRSIIGKTVDGHTPDMFRERTAPVTNEDLMKKLNHIEKLLGVLSERHVD